MITAVLTKSQKPEKRFKVIVEDDFKNKKKTIHFGSGKPKGKGAYIDHNDDKIKDAWIARHKVRENWEDYFTAGFWSKWVLWNKKTLKESLEDLEKRFKIELS